MFISDITTTPPSSFETSLQQLIYTTLSELEIPFERVENSPSRTMEDAVEINEKLGGNMAKNLLLTNRQQTKYWLLVLPGKKPFITRDFSSALNIARVSFASAEKLQEMLGVELGATNILCALEKSPIDFQLVIDSEVLKEDAFMLPDGTINAHIKISTKDLIEKIIPKLNYQPTYVNL